MKSAAKLMLAGACALALTAAAGVQAQPTGGRAILYELPNFQGRSITIYRSNANLADSNFNDMAMSGHFDGDWSVCTDSNFRGSCTRVAGDVSDLSRQGVARSISSLQQSGGGWSDNNDGRGDRGDDRGGDRGDRGDRGGPGYQDDRGYNNGGGYNPGPAIAPGEPYPGGGRGTWEGGVPGRSVVFFARPQSGGQDIAAYDRTAADWFCRRQGLGAAVYYDVSQRGRGFRWQGGGFAVNAPVLRDVVCKKY